MDPWLETRLKAAPRELADRIRAVLGDAPRMPQSLNQAAERLLAEAKAGSATRATALSLLAADALVTYACEWTAEFAPEQLGAAR